MCSAKKHVLKNFAKFTGHNLCWSLFFKKVAGLTPVFILTSSLVNVSYSSSELQISTLYHH